MKLAFCLFKYFPHGGLQRDFMQIAQLCAANNHEVHVHTMHWEGERPASFVIHEYPPKNGVRQNHSQATQFATALKISLKAQYDLIIGFNKMPGLDLYFAADGCFAAKLNEKKFAWLQRLLPRNIAYKRLEESVFATESHTHILYIAEKNQLTYQAHYALSDTRQSLLPPGIHNHFQSLPQKALVSSSLRNRLGLKDNMIQLLIVASRFKTKGLDRAILAIASLRTEMQSKIQFNVIGNDHSKPFLRLTKQYNVQTFINYLGAQNNIADWMQACDLLLHPAYHESAGLTLLEAIASGLPILTTASCGYAHYVLDANAGKVINNPFTQANLNQMLVDMLSSPDDLVRYSNNAQQFSKIHNFCGMPKAALAIIEQLGEAHAHTIS